MDKKIKIFSLLSGLLFLLSSVAKSWDISAFSTIITQNYGFSYLHFLTPLIVVMEALLGLALVFQIRLKQTALIGILLLLLFTLIYTYGLVFKGVEDCGCFGKITLLNTSPIVTFIRNGILLYLLIVIWRKGENKTALDQWTIVVALMVICLVSFMSGYTYRTAGRNTAAQKYKADTLENTPLKEFITTSKDSTYLVFVFSYTCPHCLNSIENLKQYEASGAVDKVIGIAMENPAAEKQFREFFKPEFQITDFSSNIVFRLTKTFPRAYYIRNDSLISVLSGELPCSYVFMRTQK